MTKPFFYIALISLIVFSIGFIAVGTLEIIRGEYAIGLFNWAIHLGNIFHNIDTLAHVIDYKFEEQ